MNVRKFLACLVALGLVVGGAAVVVRAQTEPVIEHVSVRAGEGLWTVASRLCPGNVNVQYQALQQANPWYGVGMKPGTVLHVPEGSCQPTTTSTVTPTTSVTSTSSTTTTAVATTAPTPTTVAPTGGFPTPETTGARVVPASVIDGNVATSFDGQVIEGVTINGNLTIRHNNVTVRDVVINGTGRYMLHVDNLRNSTACPVGVTVEYVEVDGSGVDPDQIPVYAECGATFDHLYVHDSGRGIRTVSNSTVTASYAIADRHVGSIHRTAYGNNGGQHNVISGNTFICEGTNCSSALSIYGDFDQPDDFLVEGNLVATSSYYCIYGGSVGSDQFPQGSNISIVGNHFSTALAPNCGRSAPITAFANGARGNLCHGNVWHETGADADNACG